MSYQYDVFISFKNSTEFGLTEDRDIACKFFESLNGNNIKVFFSNNTLSDKGISNYMLEIQNALEDSRSILVIFSQVEYISTGWVAQEWMTFLNLLMNDPRRNIYIFSIKDNITELPPFLRPYECFGDYNSAITHITNGVKSTNQQIKEGICKRDFLNAYWGLFGNINNGDFINKPMLDKFYNHKVYCLKSDFLKNGSTNAYKEGLLQLIEAEHNPLASYLLSRLYRDVKYLDLPLSNKLCCDAYNSFLKKINNSSEESEVSLWILTDKDEYDGAFYMCDVIHDVLDAYDVKTEVRIIFPNDKKKYYIGCQKKVVVLWSSVTLDVTVDFLEFLNQNSEKVIIVLNSFRESRLDYDIKKFEHFENCDNKDITKICRILLGGQ